MSEIVVSASWRAKANAPSLIHVDTMTLSKRSSEPAEPALRAAQRALEFVKPGMTVGLGSGSAAQLWIRLLGEQVRDHALKIKAIASSRDSELLGRSYGIPFVSFEDCELLDFTVDGADEIGPRLALIKGRGGNLLREKIVASASRRLLIVADESRVVDVLGRSTLPVEVIPTAAPLVGRALQELGFTARVRVQNDGTRFLTGEGNLVLDCSGLAIEDPYAIAAEIDAIVGVVEHGIFLDMVDIALITSGSDLIERTR
jgi:ribose 5-phosphate isomerase A